MYEDPPNPEATRFIKCVHDVFENGHQLLFALVEKKLLPYVDTPSFKRMCKASDEMYEIGGMFVNRKIKELQEMANKQDASQETEGKIN